jgi:hypothetical protein
MVIAPAELERAALNMEPELRARLAAALIRSLEGTEDVDEDEIEALWLQEAEERCRQIDAGEVELVPADDVLKRLRKRDD